MTNLLGKKHFFESPDTHYDIRYFTTNLKMSDKHAIMFELLEELIDIANIDNIKIILMHGGLIGWYWNKKILPWDSDIDISVSYEDFLILVTHKYVHPRFHLDINPNYVNRQSLSKHHTKYDEPNKIDARIIDKTSGVYIDITALYSGKTGILQTKCPHFYKYDDMYPLKIDVFENIPIYIPNNIKNVIIQEYSKRATENKSYRGYTFDDDNQLWIQNRSRVHAKPTVSK